MSLARITTALANEGARVLEDGFAIRASDIDVIYCNGFGFPRHRGGPMFYADTIGLGPAVEAIRELAKLHGARDWTPAGLLVTLAGEGATFGSWQAGREGARDGNGGRQA